MKTPRTDKAFTDRQIAEHIGDMSYVPDGWGFARTLETELAEAKAALGEAGRYIDPTASADAAKLTERIRHIIE